MSKQHSVETEKNIQQSVRDEGQTAEKTPLTKGQPLDHDAATTLQQSVGNQAVQNMVIQHKASKGAGPSPVDEDVAQQIRSEKGGGQQVDRAVADKTSQAVNQDVSGAKVHTDDKADQLAESVNARAFTTGNDIFFRKGEYNPGSSDGQKLISHELTHTAQQSGGSSLGTPSGVQGKMSVNDPGDQFEKEADKVAHKVAQTPNATGAGVQRMPEEEQLQAKGPEDEELQAKADDEESLQMQEDEELQAKAEDEEQLQMQEDEELQAKSEDEESLQMKQKG